MKMRARRGVNLKSLQGQGTERRTEWKWEFEAGVTRSRATLLIPFLLSGWITLPAAAAICLTLGSRHNLTCAISSLIWEYEIRVWKYGKVSITLQDSEMQKDWGLCPYLILHTQSKPGWSICSVFMVQKWPKLSVSNTRKKALWVSFWWRALSRNAIHKGNWLAAHSWKIWKANLLVVVKQLHEQKKKEKLFFCPLWSLIGSNFPVAAWLTSVAHALFCFYENINMGHTARTAC